MNFVLPPKSQAGYLDPEIAGEGQKVILSDGEQVNWTPPPPRPVMPDWSQIKTIRHYFGRTGLEVYPAWLYHPSEPARLIKNKKEALEIGCYYRDATQDEQNRYGLKAVWDWREDCEWRPTPYGGTKFDAANPGPGKTVIHAQAGSGAAQSHLIEALVPSVAAAVAKALQANGPTAPAGADPKEWQEFQDFVAWRKSQEAVQSAVGGDISEEHIREASQTATNALHTPTPEEEREDLETQALQLGLKIDKRWSVERLKSEIAKKAA